MNLFRIMNIKGINSYVLFTSASKGDNRNVGIISVSIEYTLILSNYSPFLYL